MTRLLWPLATVVHIPLRAAVLLMHTVGSWCRYANGIVYACASLALGWAVDRYNWPRTYVMAAAYLLLAGMYVLEVSACHTI